MGFLKNVFGKQTCAICGKECGALGRTKLKDGVYICFDCEQLCSKYIKLSRMTLDDVKGHIEYMRRLDQVYQEQFKPSEDKKSFPSGYVEEQGIEFCDELGMFRILHSPSKNARKLTELFRYDQVASYEPYVEETKEEGKEPEFRECGIKITFVNKRTNERELKPGMRPHPYIEDEVIKICFSKKRNEGYTGSACAHFNTIFGVFDDKKGRFGLGLSKNEQRDIAAGVGMMKSFGTIFNATKGGEANIDAQTMAELQENMNALQDSQTGGLSVYSRRADAAEAKVK